MKVGSSDFLTVGAVGFLLSFVAWLFWLLLTVSALLASYLGYGHPGYMSGIFFQNWTYRLIFHSLLYLSLALEGFGCVGLKQKYGSTLALICGIFLITSAAVLTSSLVIAIPVSLLLWVTYYNPTLLLNVGLLIWGLTLLSLRKSLQPHARASWIGSIFIIVSALTLTWFAPAMQYWGIEWWLLFLGGPYAVNSIVTSWYMMKLRKV
jgi:hypothetical protein